MTLARKYVTWLSKYVPIIMMTVSEDAEKITQSYLSGATDFVIKPVNWEILSHRLHYMVKANTVWRKLEQSELRLTKAKQMARFGDWEWQVNNDQLHWSDEIYSMVELNRDEFIPDTQNFKNFIHPADMPYVSKHI